MDTFSPTRLVAARELRGYKRCELAALLQITKGAVSNYESGIGFPSQSTVQRMRLTLNFPYEWFYQPDLDLIPTSAPSFRSRRSMGAVLRTKAVRNGELAISVIYPAFQKKFRFPSVDIPEYVFQDKSEKASLELAEKAARELRLAWKLGQGPIKNMVHLLESKGCGVFWLSEPDDKVDAWSVWRNGTPFVMLNAHKTDGERGRFDACHELGHLILHRNAKIIEGLELESQAHEFAAAFLMPAEIFKEECPKQPRVNDFLKLKQRWGVSVAAMVRRAYKLGILSQRHYEMAYKELAMRNWRKGEPNSWPREKSKAHQFVFESLSKKGVSPEKFAQSLFLNVEDLFDLAPQAREFSGLHRPQATPVSRANLTLLKNPRNESSEKVHEFPLKQSA
jgi:Zn-dependent peptidase ImmA (M78 family)/transcriptional regulator with XRE-family HTH domain